MPVPPYSIGPLIEYGLRTVAHLFCQPEVKFILIQNPACPAPPMERGPVNVISKARRACQVKWLVHGLDLAMHTQTAIRCPVVQRGNGLLLENHACRWLYAGYEIIKRVPQNSRRHTGNKQGHITSAAYSKAMRATGFEGTPHGFRTSFRTWVQDQQATTYDIAETCLAHQIGGKVERAYARSDMLDQRRIVMGKWAAMVTGEAAQVVRLRG
jgi:hypothetical protein